MLPVSLIHYSAILAKITSLVLFSFYHTCMVKAHPCLIPKLAFSIFIPGLLIHRSWRKSTQLFRPDTIKNSWPQTLPVQQSYSSSLGRCLSFSPQWLFLNFSTFLKPLSLTLFTSLSANALTCYSEKKQKSSGWNDTIPPPNPQTYLLLNNCRNSCLFSHSIILFFMCYLAEMNRSFCWMRLEAPSLWGGK